MTAEIQTENNLAISTRELAAKTGTSAKYWENLRQRGEGPHFVKLGSRVVYMMNDVADYLEGRRVSPKNKNNNGGNKNPSAYIRSGSLG